MWVVNKMRALDEIRGDRSERFRYEARKFIDENTKKINRKLDYQEQCAEQIDISHEMNLLKMRVLVEYRKLQGLDTKFVHLADIDSGREMTVNVVYLYNNYVLTDNGFIYLLIRKNGERWMARTVDNLIRDTIEQVNAINVYFALDHPHKWNKAPIYNKIKQALEQLLDV